MGAPPRHGARGGTGRQNAGRKMTHRPEPMTRRTEWFAEIALVTFGWALAISTTRFFVDDSMVWTLIAVASAAWLVATVCRRLPWNETSGAAVFLLLGLWLLFFLSTRDTLFYGLPTAQSASQLVEIIQSDMADLPVEIAPVRPRSGHAILLGTLIWASAGYISSAAMTLRLTFWAPLPHVVGIIALGVLARDQGRLLTAVALLTALAAYALTQSRWRLSEIRWIPTPRRAARRQLAGGIALLSVAALGALGIQNLLGWDAEPIINFRQSKGDDTTNVVSPFVDVGSFLNGAGKNTLLFTGEASTPAYWRLTALEEYDSDLGIWVLANSYESVPAELNRPEDPERSAATTVNGLGGFWVPSPNEPVRVESPLALGWDPQAGSLITSDRNVESGDEFRFVANEVPSTADLESAQPAAADEVLLDTTGMPPELGRIAAGLGQGRTPYEQALALQNWSRSTFTYDDTVDLSRSEDPLSDFLLLGSGFCQQFSTAFALGARSLGLPTRVVVGFTPGEPQPDADEVTDRTYEVYGRQAHAWPEVLFEGIGWVPFEPTPGRGDPATADITGVAPAQAIGAEPTVESEAPATINPTTVPAPTATSAAPTTTVSPDRAAGESPGSTGEDNRGAPIWMFALGAALVIALIAAIRVSRSRPGPARLMDEVEKQWIRAVDSLTALDLTPDPAETPSEFSRRAEGTIHSDSIVKLAELESRRRWSGIGTSAAGEDLARSYGSELASAVAPD